MTSLPLDDLEPAAGSVALLALEEPVDLTTCDREPIHLPGAIQPHGVLLALWEPGLVIAQVAANAADHLGVPARELVGRPLESAFGPDAVARLRAALGRPRASGSDPLVLRLRSGVAYEATWHRIDGLLVVELEPAEPGAMTTVSTLFEDVRHATDALQRSEDVQGLCDVAAAEVRHLTGYDRVMVYRFHADAHGEVVAEARDPELEPFLGLHYPASDIPVQARRLYLLNQLRVIADVDYEPVALLAGPGGGPERLDLSFSGLRSVSPFHLAYLRNMGVQATLTISLMRGTRLWGMLSCHHRTPKRVDAQTRAACRLLGQLFSLQAVAREDQECHRHRARLADVESHLVAQLSRAERLDEALSDAGTAALHLTAADGLVARIDGRTTTTGQVPSAEIVDALLGHLRADEHAARFVCDDLPRRLRGVSGAEVHAAGVLALPLSAGFGDFLLWFRGEYVHTVTWGGDPNKPVTGDPTATAGEPGSARLGPRESFDAWSEEVRGRSRPWEPAEVTAATGLAGAVPELLLARARDRLAHMALHDPLTGLPNRALLLDRVAQALPHARGRGRSVAVLFVDLDRFKLVNDGLGHAAGDEVLCQAAERLLQVTRDDDTVARLGGDEYVVLCDAVTAPQARRLADRLVNAFRPPFSADGREVVVTASVGMVLAGPDASPAELLRDADTAMYRAKHAGRNGAVPFTAQMGAVSMRRTDIETNLRPALEAGELRLHFQPIHRLDGGLAGFEALARWPLPGGGMVSPAEFIPVAEASGLIGPLTVWALETALADLARWRAQRPDLNLTVSVNVSAVQMTGDLLPAMVADALARHDLPSEALCLEITESALVADDALSVQFLSDLRAQGVLLSIDDFGTGFSSLAYLTKLPVHEVKIDSAFVAGLPAGQADATVVATVVGLAHQLGFRALAEGVETEQQLAAVRRLGCDLAQGYLLGRPMPSDLVDALVAATPTCPER
jgi:diguanylate cyclase (GGDEF)-like protein